MPAAWRQEGSMAKGGLMGGRRLAGSRLKERRRNEVDIT